MQTNVYLERTSVATMVSAIFESGKPEVYLRSSAIGGQAGDFTSAAEVNAFIDASIKADKKFISFSVWYPDTRGHVIKNKVRLDIIKGEGQRYRHAISGWGIILFQLNFENPPLINCCVSCSSRNKAKTWSVSHPELKNPDLWDWEAVERYCGRLVGLAERLGTKIVTTGDPLEV